MDTIYSLQNAIIFNPTGKKHNAIASPAALKEVTQHRDYFSFNFIELFNGFTIYKVCKEGDGDIIQGLVAFKASIGILQCANMELNSINQKPLLLHSGLGRCMVALCCKISFEMGFDGFITFEAKNRLMPYYRRMGAINVSGLIMAVETAEAKKLVDVFF